MEEKVCEMHKYEIGKWGKMFARCTKEGLENVRKGLRDAQYGIGKWKDLFARCTKKGLENVRKGLRDAQTRDWKVKEKVYEIQK